MSADRIIQPRTFYEAAVRYVRMGGYVFPIAPRSKAPLTPHGVLDASNYLPQIKQWSEQWPDAGIAIAARDIKVGDLCFLEFDQKPTLSSWAKELGQEMPETRIHLSGGKQLPHFIFKQTEKSLALGNCDGQGDYCSDSQCAHGLKHGGLHKHEWFSFRAFNRYVLAPPSIHPDTGNPYSALADIDPLPIPDWVVDAIAARGKREKQVGQEMGAVPVSPNFDFERLMSYLQVSIVANGAWHGCDICPAAGYRHEGQNDLSTAFYWDGSSFGFKCHAQNCPSNTERRERKDGGIEGGAACLMRLVQQKKGRYVGEIWNSGEKRAITVEELEAFGVEVERNEIGDRSDFDAEPASRMEVGDWQQIACTDVANGKRLASLCGYEIAYAKDEGCWYVWNGKIWQKDEANIEVVRKAKQVAKSIYLEAAAEDRDKAEQLAKWASKSQSKERLLAMVWAAQSEGTIAKSKSDFDAVEHLFTVSNGVVDLRTGELLRHDPRNYLTQMSPYKYLGLGKGHCPQWQNFLDEALPDKDVQAFIKRAFGYSMFGSSREESIIYLYGTGNDGKGVLLYVKNGIMGGYSAPAEYKTFASMGNRSHGFGGHSDDIAGLAGKRDIYVDETDAGGRLNEGLIKSITGSGRQKASFKGKSAIEFQPQFTMWWASNFKPRLTDVGKSMRRRIKMVHMNLGLDEDKADKTLKKRLVDEEGDAILTWMVEGAVEWYEKGLATPASVRNWTEQYFHDEDVVGMWLEECCKQAPTFTVRASMAFKAFKSFCIENGYHHEHIDMKAFKKQLESKGFEQKPTKYANEWRGFMVDRFLIDDEPKINPDTIGSVM